MFGPHAIKNQWQSMGTSENRDSASKLVKQVPCDNSVKALHSLTRKRSEVQILVRPHV